MFQYRKRYLRVATLRFIYSEDGVKQVSIPQAVFTCCNGAERYHRMDPEVAFQYRKRYLRVATFAFAVACAWVLSRFQYRKRYLRVATACLESRPQTGLKWQIGKPHRIFPYFAKLYMNAHLASNSKYPVTPVFMPLSAFT